MQTYTAAELERETGFNRRTIAYYVQIRLLPKVGRRGSRTRYPKLFRDRLLFIRKVREAERAGQVQPVSLRALGRIFERTPSELISRVAEGRLPVSAEVVAAKSPRLRSPARRRAALADRWSSPGPDEAEAVLPYMADEASLSSPDAVDDESPQDRGSLPGSRVLAYRPGYDVPSRESDALYLRNMARSLQPGRESELRDALAALQEIAGRHRNPSSTVDRWLRVEVSPDITLAVRGVTDEAAPLLEKAARCLRELMRSRSQSEPDEEQDEQS